jgi:hypothetical protein
MGVVSKLSGNRKIVKWFNKNCSEEVEIIESLWGVATVPTERREVPFSENWFVATDQALYRFKTPGPDMVRIPLSAIANMKYTSGADSSGQRISEMEFIPKETSEGEGLTSSEWWYVHERVASELKKMKFNF